MTVARGKGTVVTMICKISALVATLIASEIGIFGGNRQILSQYECPTPSSAGAAAHLSLN